MHIPHNSHNRTLTSRTQNNEKKNCENTRKKIQRLLEKTTIALQVCGCCRSLNAVVAKTTRYSCVDRSRTNIECLSCDSSLSTPPLGSVLCRVAEHVHPLDAKRVLLLPKVFDESKRVSICSDCATRDGCTYARAPGTPTHRTVRARGTLTHML